MFDPHDTLTHAQHDTLTHAQLAISPELAGLDPERDASAITLRLPFACLGRVERAPDVAGLKVEAIFGDDPIEDESVVFLANGVNLHYQPTGQRSLLRLITNGADASARALVRRVHTRADSKSWSVARDPVARSSDVGPVNV